MGASPAREVYRLVGMVSEGEAGGPAALTGRREAAPPPRGLARGLTLLSIRKGSERRLAAKTPQGILDVVEAGRILGLEGPRTMDDLLQQEDGVRLQAIVKAALEQGAPGAFGPEDGIAYAPLVSRPEKIVCVGLNYRRHAAEIGAPIPKQPVLFNKFNVALNHHRGTIRLPVGVARKFDHEVELVLVMGRAARSVPEADALSYVAGYATGNDFSARDLQLDTGGQWMAGKTSDGFAPVGPYLVTADQVDPDDLAIECRVNGETRQSSTTSDLIFGCRQLVSYISRLFTLSPGDLIFTGTPEGVIQGKPAAERAWLKDGDRISCSVEKLGELTFSLVDEQTA
jgi:2-keto-4-pentenoate hydratase/2-oxohepta-3-ene-1,7-dioic acid hydratase in catechol pathway